MVSVFVDCTPNGQDLFLLCSNQSIQYASYVLIVSYCIFNVHNSRGCLHINSFLVNFCLQMPSTIEELDAAIQDTISQANSILFLNHNVLEEYESRQKKVTLCFLYLLFHFNLSNYMMITSNFVLYFCR